MNAHDPRGTQGEAVSALLMVLVLVIAVAWFVHRFSTSPTPSNNAEVGHTSPHSSTSSLLTTSSSRRADSASPAPQLIDPVPTDVRPSSPAALPDTPVVVPMLLGLTERDARTKLRHAGLAAGIVDYVPGNPSENGVVIDTGPAVGSSVPRGTAVGLVVGVPGPPKITTPDLAGRTPHEAEEQLRALGWTGTLETYDVPTNDPAQIGHVVDQDPLPGSPLDAAGTVRVRVLAFAISDEEG